MEGSFTFDVFQANRLAQEKAASNKKIDFMLEHEPREFIKTGNWVDRVVVEDLKTKKMKTLECDGVCVFRECSRISIFLTGLSI